jgi:hypothetical protein
MLHLRPRFALVAAIALIVFDACTGSSALAAGNVQTDSGVFNISINKRNVGTETFKIAPSATGVEITGELQLDMPGAGKVSENSVLKLDQNLKPTSYVRQQKQPKRGTVTVQFDSPQSKLTSQTDSGNQEQLFYLPDNHLVVLDTNFFHQYALLLTQYEAATGGPQHFNVFVPQEATPGTISLELQGKENVEIGKSIRELNHFQAVTDEIKIDIWATPQGEIQRILIPQANLEIVRR